MKRIIRFLLQIEGKGLRTAPARLVFRLIRGMAAGFLLTTCGTGPFDSAYVLELPPLPPAWLEILGPPHWRFEWISPSGLREEYNAGAGESPELSLLTEWTVPVLASPYWPERGIVPGIMRPAGALFPYDIHEQRLSLSWQGGLDAWIYFEMASGNAGSLKTPRQPHYFNWSLFREFLRDPGTAEELRQDPWLADWESIVSRILQSGFDKRRILPRPRENLRIPLPPAGPLNTPWIGTSPFAEPLFQEPGGELPLLVSEAVDTYFSAAGFLRCTRGVWAWVPW
jgi:hypothetical protein